MRLAKLWLAQLESGLFSIRSTHIFNQVVMQITQFWAIFAQQLMDMTTKHFYEDTKPDINDAAK